MKQTSAALNIREFGKSDVFSVKAVGSLGEVNPTKRVVESVLKKSNTSEADAVDIISWKEL